jgi:predicted dithiol-disulfide oxidoreductase (DUF899 family)
MEKPPIVSIEQWRQARDDLLVAEKEATRALDAIAARRRRLPMVEFPDTYEFDTPTGAKSLLDLFGGKPQLAVYQFMDLGPDAFCGGCTWLTNNVPSPAVGLLADSDVSWMTVSDMPLSQIAGYWDKMGWTTPYASSRGTTFAADCDAQAFMLTVFLRDGDQIYRTYNTTQRGVDRLVFTNSVLDLVPYGRQQEWEDSPAGWPQHPTYG